MHLSYYFLYVVYAYQNRFSKQQSYNDGLNSLMSTVKFILYSYTQWLKITKKVSYLH